MLENYWNEHKKEALMAVKTDWDDQELMDWYKNLMEELKLHAMAEYPHEDVLKQMIALLFCDTMSDAEILFVRGKPTIARPREDAAAPVTSWVQRIILHPYARLALLGIGAALNLFAGLRAIPGSLVILAAAALQVTADRAKRRPAVMPVAESAIQKESLDTFITRQMEKMDQCIADAKHLCEDMAGVVEQPFDTALATLCQHVWAVANANYPIESALYLSEKLLKQMRAEWMPYTPELRNAFEILSTRKASRTIFPAVRQTDDGAVVCRGQYLETRSSVNPAE